MVDGRNGSNMCKAKKGNHDKMNTAHRVKQDAAKPHVRIEGGKVASGCTRREFLFAAGSAALWASGCLSGARRENAALREAMRQSVADRQFGGIVCASNRGDLLCEGLRTLTPAGGPMTVDSVFDLASVGKTQTAALCALLYAQGKLDPDAPFTEYVTEHVLAKENCKITVRDLATHSGGFDNAKPYMTPDPKKYFEALYAKRPVRPRGETFDYACSNFVYLGLVVEKLTGLNLDAAAKKLLWGPLGMRETTWNEIVGNPNAVEFAPSTYGGRPRKIGEHNDICALYAPRPMGNGSSFSTVRDMLKFCDDMLRREKFPKAYYDLQFTPCFDKGGCRRSFGWDMASAESAFVKWTPTRFSDAAICHTGWTGPAIAVDPKRDFAGVVLASQTAGYEKTLGPRMRLLEMMAG